MNSRRETISLSMIALNEEECIGRALENALPYVDEMIVVDGGSTDRTADIATELGAQVLVRPWPGDFANQRNFGLDLATKEWVLIMDADEVYEEELLKNLQDFARNNIGVDMFAFPRKNYLDGVQTPAYPDSQFRFWRNHKGIRYAGKVHEKPQGFVRLSIPYDLHIIHKKTYARQARQIEQYKSLGATEVPSYLTPQ